MKVNTFKDAVDREKVVGAIRAAEACSTGEVRVHVSTQAVADAEKAAAAQFEALGMTKTALRNGVLIYIAPASQKFAIVGDTAIHSQCGPAFWQDIAHAMSEDFHAGRFTEGIVKGVARAGDALARHFPRSGERCDTNELSDDVTGD